eukprot:SM000008S22215  [mRNA]  locus=s8:413703:416048:- [translate_table: standard]
MQVQGAMAGQAGAAAYSYAGPLEAIRSIVTKEGWRTLYKGFGTVIQVAPAQALYMGTYQASRQLIPGDEQSPGVQFLAGICATVGQSLVMVPLEVVRQRQQVQTRASAGAYKGSWQTAITIWRAEGFGALYRGFLMTQLVWGPFNAVYLPLWEGSKQALARLSGAASGSVSCCIFLVSKSAAVSVLVQSWKVRELDVRYELAASFGSSSFAAAISNPMDVVKTRLQVQGRSNTASATAYSSALDAAASIWRQEGAAGFARGASSRVLWVAPSTMIMFTTYDQLMKLLHNATAVDQSASFG